MLSRSQRDTRFSFPNRFVDFVCLVFKSLTTSLEQPAWNGCLYLGGERRGAEVA